jgi:hypothetical protein
MRSYFRFRPVSDGVALDHCDTVFDLHSPAAGDLVVNTRITVLDSVDGAHGGTTDCVSESLRNLDATSK